MSTFKSIEVKDAVVEAIFNYDVNTVYTYFGIPTEKANEWKNADSQGKYFHANIRGKFEFSKDAVK